jgi:hypothetical protein
MRSHLMSALCDRGALAPVTTTADPSGSYVGVVTTDAANTSVGLPTPTFSLSTSMDWVDFDNPFRVWGADGTSALFDPLNVNWCGNSGTTTCQLYDYTLRPVEAVPLMRNVYGTWTNDGACPASTDPSTATNVIADYTGAHFLLSAIEIMDPWMNPNGNYNGLCESGEVCVFTPNLGSYQGAGDPFTTVPCTTGTGNAITAPITLYAYPDP